MDLVSEHIADLARFIEASPSSYHAAAELAGRLEAAGFTELSELDDWSSRAGQPDQVHGTEPADGTGSDATVDRGFVRRDGAVIAWVRPEALPSSAGFRILGAHTDSPGFKLKPKPSSTGRGWLQAGVEVYGGPLLNSWLDRELEFAGRLVTRHGAEHLVRTGPFARIPQLAIHLDRDVNSGLTLDRQRHMQPVIGVVPGPGRGAGPDEAVPGDVVGHLAALANLDPADVAGYDILTVDTQAPQRFGVGASLFAAGRLDNLSSVHAGLRALLGAPDDAPHTSVLAAFDHEELGSETRSGASGPLLSDVLTRLAGGTEAQRLVAYAASWCVSADAGHAVHPNYPEKHDPANQPVLGRGPLLKINANQRYATDAHGAALWNRACEAAGVPVQEFVSNNALPCGSTIGPLTATRLGIRTVDVGIPLLSMHSARELAHVDDAHSLTKAIGAFFAGA